MTSRIKGLILGIGVNDSDTAVQKFEDGKLVWVCPYYLMWKSMINRCYNPRIHERLPTYIGCSVSPEFLLFSQFKEWVIRYEQFLNMSIDSGLFLDKDLKGDGKVYSSENCLLIPHELNSFFLRGPSKDLPLGVDTHKGRFRARCANGDKDSQHLGYFNSAIDAHYAWKVAKLKRAEMLADKYKDFYGIEFFITKASPLMSNSVLF